MVLTCSVLRFDAEVLKFNSARGDYRYHAEAGNLPTSRALPRMEIINYQGYR
jgi:hypothetical protein